MQTLIVKTDSAAHAKFLSSFLKTVSIVKSVRLRRIESDADLPSVRLRKAGSAHVVNKPAAAYNWTNPSRPATDEEIDAMLDECEAQYAAGEGMPLEKARALTKKKIAEWKKKRRSSFIFMVASFFYLYASCG